MPRGSANTMWAKAARKGACHVHTSTKALLAALACIVGKAGISQRAVLVPEAVCQRITRRMWRWHQGHVL